MATANTGEHNTVEKEVTEERDQQFLYILKHHRSILLARLQSLGLLASFLEAENGTNPKP